MGRLAQDLEPEGPDDPGLLRERDELDRRDRAVERVRPAHEGFGTAEPPVGDVDDRLERDGDLAPPPRAAEVGLQREPALGLGAHLEIEDRVTALPARLRAVHRDVGVADRELCGVVAAEHADADAGGGRELGLARVQRQAEDLEHPGRDLVERVGIGVEEQERELVAAEPGDRVARPHAPDEPLGDREEQVVAGRVARAPR